MKAHFDRVLSDQNLRWAEALAAQQRAVESALASADKAVSKSETSAREWQVASNEWRGAMTDRERTFLTRAEFEQAERRLTEQIAQMEKWTARMEGRGGGMASMWGWAVGAVGLILGFLALADRVQR